MHSTNGHGPKRAILYARVSTEEQARSGYSLAQQIEALRAHAAREGYEVVEEVSDPGQSGASLARPGMDRVRDLVAEGGVSVVLAQDRDRIAREPAYHYLLKQEFVKHSCKIRAMNDRGDETPEGELTDGILDQLAKFERAKIAERTRRGKTRKAREGRAVTPTANYGFRFNEAKDGLVVHEPEMQVIRKVFEMAAEGLGVGAIQSRLHAQGIHAPKGGRIWARPVIRRLVESDVYKPHSYEEIACMVSAEALARLDAHEEYGVQWFNRQKVSRETVSEPDGKGGRQYKTRRTAVWRPREEWIAVPVPAYLSSGLVEQARASMAANKGAERKHLAREWELRGLMRCSCGSTMGTQTTNPYGRWIYYYYTCRDRRELRKMGSCRQRSLQAKDVEPLVWEFVSGLLKDPEKIRVGMNTLIDREREAGPRDARKEAEAWAEKIAECDRLRGAYQDQQAAGLMTLGELASKLKGLDETRKLARAELAALGEREGTATQLERDRDALLESWSSMVPEALDSLTGEERNKVYRMLRLEVTPTLEGFEITGALRGCLQNATSTLEEVPGIGPKTLEKIKPFAGV
ncbi:MAG: recombinase family protein [Actinomycetota bacterium]|nr:recombinase family protein [Actinomycetota bacterium]MDP9484205.1 recombinase family protein [Actinomycetota bacterium]